jgi:GntR family transcriptional regulator
MNWQIQTSSRVPIYEQLADQIRQAVALGQLQPRERLPSVRQLSRELLINPNTVARTYQELEREGALVSRPGLGIFVAEPRSDLTPAARERRVLEPLDRWLALAVRLGYTPEEVVAIVEQRLGRFQWNAPVKSTSTEGTTP